MPSTRLGAKKFLGNKANTIDIDKIIFKINATFYKILNKALLRRANLRYHALLFFKRIQKLRAFFLNKIDFFKIVIMSGSFDCDQ